MIFQPMSATYYLSTCFPCVHNDNLKGTSMTGIGKKTVIRESLMFTTEKSWEINTIYDFCF